MKLILFDTNEELCQEWGRFFYPYLGGGDVVIKNIPLERLHLMNCDGLVSPANSFGIMDGGIDLAIREWLPRVQKNVTDMVARTWGGYIPMGAASIVKTDTGAPKPRYLVVAPTMPYPMRISAFAVYNVMRNLLAEVRMCALRTHAPHIKRLACPGLGTATGGVEPAHAAQAMALAYKHHIQAKTCESWDQARQYTGEIAALSRLVSREKVA